MSSVALQILDAMQDQLGLASVTGWDGAVHTPPDNLTIAREIIGLVTERHVAVGPVISVAKGGELPTTRKHYTSPMNIHTMEALITVAAKAENVAPSVALDEPSSWVIKALQSDPTLGGIAHFIVDRGHEDEYTTYQDSTFVLAARQMRIHVEFHARTDNPDARS